MTLYAALGPPVNVYLRIVIIVTILKDSRELHFAITGNFIIPSCLRDDEG